MSARSALILSTTAYEIERIFVTVIKSPIGLTKADVLLRYPVLTVCALILFALAFIPILKFPISINFQIPALRLWQVTDDIMKARQISPEVLLLIINPE